MAKKQKKIRETEKEMKQEEAKEDEAETEGEKQAEKHENAMDPEEHPDVEQDIELIKKLLDEYIGQESEMEKGEAETLKKLAKEAYEAYKEMGYSEEEAKDHAGHALKLAKHMATKQTEQEADCDDESGEKAADKADAKHADKESDESEKSEAGCETEEDESEAEVKDEKESEAETKESAQVARLEKLLLETKAELAALKVDRAAGEVEKYVETKLAESKLPRAITKAFRETAGTIKSTKDFDTKWAIFSEGLKRNRVELNFGTALVEKGAATDGAAKKTKVLDFSDCAE